MTTTPAPTDENANVSSAAHGEVDAPKNARARFAARVDRLHAEYCDAVVALFEKHKAEAGYGPEETLTVV